MKTSQAEIETLRTITTPTLANAIELFNVRPRNEGFMSPNVRCLFPDLGVMVGHAVTARFAARQEAQKSASRIKFWRHVLTLPEPRVLAFQDLDNPPGVGAYFGEVQTNVHRRLGCVGVVTNGRVRDLDEVHALGFHYFAGGVCVSHAYVHMVDFGGPVEVGGLTIRPGDLVHADKHGVLLVPAGITGEIAGAVSKVCARENEIISHCKSESFSLEELDRHFESD